MVIAWVVYRKMTAYAAELALYCGLIIIVKIAGCIRFTRKDYVYRQSFSLGVRKNSKLSPDSPVGNKLKDKVED